MRRYFLLVVCLCLASLLRAQNKLELISPNGELKVSLNLSDKIYYSIDYNGDVLLKDNTLQLTLRNQVLGQNPKLRRQKRMSVDEQLTPIVPLKYSKVNNRYNQLLLTFKDYAVEFRAFDDGVAYRFITSQKGDVEVMNEEFAINFPSDYLLHLQQPGGFHTAYEEPYTHVQSNAWKPEERIAVLPVLIDTQKDPYIIMDEGWAKSTRDPYTPNPKVDLHELIRYGKEKNVGIVLWLTWLTVENNFDLFKTFNEWGVKGLKIDFMDRSDQWMVNFYERVAREAAKHHLFVDFHGSFKPAGLEYKYPNVLSYEGVRGMEQMGGCYPDNSLYLPFMRNAVGPMDYTPGAMISMQPNVYRSERPNAASIGTRAYQLALFVVFESGLQMLADNPTLYYRNEDCTRFITQVPVTWDETVALEAKAGEYVIVAKRKGDKWFIGGMTNNGKKEREFTIKLDFLNKDRSYQMTSFEDGINAGRQAMDYRCKSSQVKAGEQLTIKMVRNGGFAAVIE